MLHTQSFSIINPTHGWNQTMHNSKWSDLEHTGRVSRRAIDMLARRLGDDENAHEISELVSLTNSIFYGCKVVDSLVKTHDLIGRIERLEDVAHLVKQHENIKGLEEPMYAQ